MSHGSGEPMGTKHHFYHDPGGNGSLSTTVISALAEVEGTDVRSLGFSLHDYVDPDALDAIFAPKLDGTARDGSRIEFTVPGYTVTLEGDSHVVVTDAPEPVSV